MITRFEIGEKVKSANGTRKGIVEQVTHGFCGDIVTVHWTKKHNDDIDYTQVVASGCLLKEN